MKRLGWLSLTFAVMGLMFVGLFSWSPASGQSQKAKKAKALAAKNPAVAEAERGEWSRWRGPNGDGISYETGLLTEWPAAGPPLAWRVKGLGGGYSTVAVAGGKIFTLGNKRGRNNMVCLK